MARKPRPKKPALLQQVRIASRRVPEGWPLHLPREMEPGVDAPALIAREALRWTYVLRSRPRWVTGQRARERNEQEAREALLPIGIGPAQLDDLAQSDLVVVRIPYIDEQLHWESRIFPWEYVLAAATRERRLRAAGEGPRDPSAAERRRVAGDRPRPMTVLRELQVQTPLLHPLPDPATMFSGGLRALFVECLPSELRDLWSLDSERDRMVGALPAETSWHVLHFPTLEDLRSAVAAHRPHFIHFAGVDSHQGLRELRQAVGVTAQVHLGAEPTPAAGDPADAAPRPQGLQLVDRVMGERRLMRDGVLLQGPRPGEPGASAGPDAPPLSYPRLVHAHELALALMASGHTAYLVSFNLWNSAARLAPLLVAERAALAAVGFQDAFDDALAEFVHATFYNRIIATEGNLPAAFQQTWETVRELPESVDATGITLWAGAPLLGGPAAAPTSVAAPPEAQPLRVDVRVVPHQELNYAVLHNAQPLFEQFVLECNRPAETVFVDVDVAVHMGAETARYGRRVPMSHARVALTREVHVPLTAEVARTVREAISSSLVVEVRHGQELLYRDTHRLRLLPVDQWRDNRRDGRWLPSFVQPRDPAVAKALEQAQRYVRVLRDDPNAGFEGYQAAPEPDEASLAEVDRQVEAIWATLLHDWRLGYINPPPTYSGTLDSQRLRMPSAVLEHRSGTCIDLALLFAACLELVDIYPVIFLLEGHALPGWWRHPSFRDEYAEMPAKNYVEIVEASATENAVPNAQTVAWHTGKASWPEVRRWIRERKLVPIETVRLTENCGFAEAIEAGIEALSERRDFDSLLDIVTARLEQVTPLPVRKEAP